MLMLTAKHGTEIRLHYLNVIPPHDSYGLCVCPYFKSLGAIDFRNWHSDTTLSRALYGGEVSHLLELHN